MAALKIIAGILLIAAGISVLVFFFRPRMIRKMMKMSSGIYRGSAARREMGDTVYRYSVFPRVMGGIWLLPILAAMVLIGLGISLF